MREVRGVCWSLVFVTVSLFVACGPQVANAQSAKPAAPYVWIEAETPSESKGLEPSASAWGKTHLISGELLNIGVKDTEVEKTVPKEGAVFGYEFQIESAGDYEVWARVGMERARSDFDWRVDGGEWTRVTYENGVTTDLYEFNRWNNLGWLKFKDANLAAGKHKIELRLPITYKKGKDGKEQPNRILNMFDAFCIYKGTWRPNGPFKPGAEYQTEADKAAVKHIFKMPAPAADGERTAMSLNGTWMFARFDEMGLVEDPYGPVAAPPAPETLYWHAFEVPGDRDQLLPDMVYCHRYFLRARVDVPGSYAGKQMLLDFDETNFITTVYVNGRQMGNSDLVASPMKVDITEAVKPGQVNEIWVGIKDAYYGMRPSHLYDNIRYGFEISYDNVRGRGNQGETMRFLYPLKGATYSGITAPAKLVATGKVYTDDVYAIPSVKNKELKLQVTVSNPGAAAADVVVENEVEPFEGGAVELILPAATAKVAAGGQSVLDVEAGWENPHLWWPDDTFQYNVVTRVKVDGQVVDTVKTKFGFREWSIEGTRFALNGVPWQFRADLLRGETPEDSIETWKRTGQNMFRLRFQRMWQGMHRDELLDFMDANGVPVRCNVSTFDGQHASYRLAISEGPKGDRKKFSNAVLFENVRKQSAARMVEYRNHPCVFVWELDNEIVYINARNRGDLDVVEPEFAKTAEMIEALDMQGRGQMVAGGRALMNQDLPINGCHYEAAEKRHYPDAAYGLRLWTEQSSKQPWPMALDRPIFMSEEYFAHGKTPAWFATVGGETCFSGLAECRDAVSLLARMYSEGYRWQELGAFHFWFSKIGNASQYIAWQPVCALVREWNSTFGAKSTVKRTVMVRNDTHYDDPITLSWKCTVGGATAAADSRELSVKPGYGRTVEVSLPMPDVSARTAGEFVLACSRKGKEVWTDTKAFSVIDPDAAAVPQLDAAKLAVYDPQGQVKARLQQRGIEFTDVKDLDSLPEGFETIIIGKDALTPRQSTNAMWLTMAAEGKRILVIDQENPLHYQAVPADFDVTDYVGRIAFPEDLTHPVFAGLKQQDFFCWSGDHIVYRNVYSKASQGARSLAQCDDGLGYSAVAECRVNEGLMLLCQMVVAEKLDSDPIARRLFDNMVNYTVGYERIRNNTAIVLPTGDPRKKLLQSSGLVYREAIDPVAAMKKSEADIIIADATPEILARLSSSMDIVEAFTDRGGWLMLWNVTPAGLDSFNRIVGIDHLMRPFRIENVALAAKRDPLSAGMSQRDFTLYSGRKIFSHKSIQYVVGDMFNYIVDLDDIVPFLDGPGIGTPNPDRPSSLANGFTNVEAWPYILYLNIPEDGTKTKLEYKLPRRETLRQFSIVPNASYHFITKLKLVPDGDESRAQTVDLAEYSKSENPRQDFELEPMECEQLTIICDEIEMDERAEKPTGIDNMWIKVARSEEFKAKVKPLLNIGGINRYPMGKGGIILNQLNVKDSEPVPVNAEKKKSILNAILGNLNATFTGGKLLVIGEGLKYTPVSLEGKCNLYITADKGWFDAEHDFSHLPLGRQKFQGVQYDIRDFKTSPLENAITLEGFPNVDVPDKVTDIAVEARADMVFFLHAYNSERGWQPGRKNSDPPVVFQYVIHYADGKQAVVDVIYELGADAWMQEDPRSLREAALAWAVPFPKDETKQACLYSMQWKNPRPGIEIKSIDIQYPEGQRKNLRQPIVFAITTGTAIE